MHAPVTSEPSEATETPVARRPLIRPDQLARGWRAALREFAIIVAGVLSALAAQSCWQSRDERGREQDYLHQLLQDTRENERRLEVAIAMDSTAGLAIGRLADGLFGSGPLPPADTLVAWFRDQAFASSDFQPLTGSYGALLMAGDLRLIRNDSLRALIVSYAAMLDHEQDMLRLFLEQSAGQPDRLAEPMPFLRAMFFGDSSTGPKNIDFESLRRNRQADAMFFAVQISNANRITHLRRLRDETQRLRSVLETEPAIR